MSSSSGWPGSPEIVMLGDLRLRRAAPPPPSPPPPNVISCRRAIDRSTLSREIGADFDVAARLVAHDRRQVAALPQALRAGSARRPAGAAWTASAAADGSVSVAMRPGSARNSSVSKPALRRAACRGRWHDRSRRGARPTAARRHPRPAGRRTASTSPRASRPSGSVERTSVCKRSSGPSSVSRSSLPDTSVRSSTSNSGHDPVRVGERDAAARDAERVAADIDLAAFAHRHAAGENRIRRPCRPPAARRRPRAGRSCCRAGCPARSRRTGSDAADRPSSAAGRATGVRVAPRREDRGQADRLVVDAALDADVAFERPPGVVRPQRDERRRLALQASRDIRARRAAPAWSALRPSA